MERNQLATRIDALLASVKELQAELRGGTAEESAACAVSFVSPCYNEAENLPELLRRIRETCEGHGIVDYEVIWIENGSEDDSYEVMQRLHAEEPHLRVIQLSRNFGYQGAISCALHHARGEWIAVLDGDLQDPPELVPEMLAQARREGCDVVYGVRAKRQEGALKRFGYWIFYRLWRSIAEIRIPVDAGDFCVLSRRVAAVIDAMPERQRFVRGLRAWAGFRQAGFPYERQARASGATKFNLRGMLALALDGMLAYSVVPLRLMILSGIGLVGLVFLLSLVQGVLRITAYLGWEDGAGILPPGLTQLNLLLVGLMGVNLLCLGVVGEYVGRIYHEVKSRPLYLVKDRLPRK